MLIEYSTSLPDLWFGYEESFINVNDIREEECVFKKQKFDRGYMLPDIDLSDVDFELCLPANNRIDTTLNNSWHGKFPIIPYTGNKKCF